MIGTQVRSFGTFHVTTGDREITAWGAGGSRTAFQYLLARRGQMVSRAQLASVIWPDRTDEKVGNSLSVALHGLRRALKGGDIVLATTRAGYRLDVAEDGRLWVDFDELELRAGAARSARQAGDVDAEMAAAEQAAELYAGEFLPFDDAEWVTARRAWLASLLLRTLHAARATALRTVRHDDAIRMCEHALRLDPCDEASYQTLMWIHGRAGERSRAARWYGVCVGRLADDLDVEPAPLTLQLFERVMRGSQAMPADVPALLLEAG